MKGKKGCCCANLWPTDHSTHCCLVTLGFGGIFELSLFLAWHEGSYTYMKNAACTQIIRCDIKPHNILLDEDFTAKISDLLSQTASNQANANKHRCPGYVAPEWFKSIGITAKVDVYSFGVILLELICCRRNVELEVVTEEDQKILTYWAMDYYRCGRVDFLVEGDDEAILVH
jgi:serine/threonine protein kinase